MEDTNLTRVDQFFLSRSDKPQITRRRRAIVIASGLGFATALVIASWVTRSWQLVLGIALLYIAITVWEKVAYANAVLVYKSLIRKLMSQTETRNPAKDSQQSHEADP